MELLALCIMLICYDGHGNKFEFSYPTPLTEQHAPLVVKEKDHVCDIISDDCYDRYWVVEDWREYYDMNGRDKRMNCYEEQPLFLK